MLYKCFVLTGKLCVSMYCCDEASLLIFPELMTCQQIISTIIMSIAKWTITQIQNCMVIPLSSCNYFFSFFILISSSFPLDMNQVFDCLLWLAQIPAVVMARYAWNLSCTVMNIQPLCSSCVSLWNAICAHNLVLFFTSNFFLTPPYPLLNIFV